MESNATQTLHKRIDETAQERTSATLRLLYHELTPQKSQYSYALSTDDFRGHLELFQRIRATGEGWLWPAITFDDGHLSNFTCALPLLSSFDLTAHFFITAGWVSNRPEYMTWEQLSELHRTGQQIGAHGWSHALLTHCSDAELDKELSSARLLLEDKLGTSITTMSLPGGRFNGRVLEACRNAGYTQVFSSIPRAEISSRAALMGRVNLRDGVTLPWLEKLLQPDSGVLRKLLRTYYMKEMAQRALGDRMYAGLWSLLNRAPAGARVA